MTRAMRGFRGVVGCLTLLTTTAMVFGDWPQWRGTHGDAKVEFNAPPTWPKQLAQKWKTTVGLGDSTPALVGDRLYVFTREGADEVATCLDANTGKQIWQQKYPPKAMVTGAAASHPGPRSSVAVANGKVVTFGITEILSCWDAESGKLAWRKEFNDEFKQPWPRFYTGTSPLVVDNLCIVQIGGSGKGAVAAFDLSTGDVKWKVDGDGPAYATPALMVMGESKIVVAQTEKSLVGLSLTDGKELFKVAAATARMAQNAPTPVIEGSMIIYTGQGSGTHAIEIKKQGDGYSTAEKWNNAQIGTTFNTPVLKDGKLYGISDRGNIYCMDAGTGKSLWTDTTRHTNFGSIVDGGSVLLALTQKAELIAFEPSEKAYKELAKFHVSDSDTYAYPVVSGNKIFIKDKDSVTLFGT